MSRDLTLLYYSAQRINVGFAAAVLGELSLSRPTGSAFETLFQAKDVPQSIWQVYVNVLTLAKRATTPFVACCEDDTLYAPLHFTYRPAPDTFAYDRSRWVITRKLSADGKRREAFFYWRERTQMAMCIAPRALLIETLEEKFAKYPVPPVSTDVAKKAGWGEPGRYEKNLGLTLRKREYFDSPEPSVTFNHAESLMGRRRVNPDDIIKMNLAPWGDATALWERIHG